MQQRWSHFSTLFWRQETRWRPCCCTLYSWCCGSPGLWREPRLHLPGHSTANTQHTMWPRQSIRSPRQPVSKPVRSVLGQQPSWFYTRAGWGTEWGFIHSIIWSAERLYLCFHDVKRDILWFLPTIKQSVWLPENMFLKLLAGNSF